MNNSISTNGRLNPYTRKSFFLSRANAFADCCAFVVYGFDFGAGVVRSEREAGGSVGADGRKNFVVGSTRRQTSAENAKRGAAAVLKVTVGKGMDE